MSYQLPSAFLQKFTPKEIHELKRVFKEHDHDYAAAIAVGDLHTVLLKMGENVTPAQTTTILQQVPLARASHVTFPEFLTLFYDLRNGGIALDAAALVSQVAISAAPVAPTTANTAAANKVETVPFFRKKSAWEPDSDDEDEQETAAPTQASPFAQKAQWPPAGAAASTVASAPAVAAKPQWPPANGNGSASTAAPSATSAGKQWPPATTNATPPKETASKPHWPPTGSSAKPQWQSSAHQHEVPPPAPPSPSKKQWPPTQTAASPASPSKKQWPPTQPAAGPASPSKPQWPPTQPAAGPASPSKPQWPPTQPAAGPASPSKPQWPPTQPAAGPASPSKRQWPPTQPAAGPASPSKPQWPPTQSAAGPSPASPTKPHWPPAASLPVRQERSPSLKATWPPTNAQSTPQSSGDVKRQQWPPTAPSTAVTPPAPSKPLPPPPEPVMDAHARDMLQRRASAAAMYNANVTIHEVKGPTDSLHSYSEEETAAFTEHINNCLQHDRELASVLPITAKDGLFRSVTDGMLLCKLVNAAVPETIDMRAVNRKKKPTKPLNVYEMTENQNLCINAAKSIGCSVVNIGPTDLIDGRPILVLGLVWQIIKIQLTSTINLKSHPELVRLLLEGESLEAFMKLPPDQILLRWVNYHLKAAGHAKTVTNFSTDVRDATAYSVLLHQIAPQTCDACHETTAEDRAAHVIENARKLQIETFIKPRDITSGNPKLNMSFVAQLFNTCPALDIVPEEIKQLEEILYDDVGDTREERVFRMWINSLGIDEVYINHLFSDLRDGINLLKVFEKIEKGLVAWQKVNLLAPNKFKQVENCNYCVDLGKKLQFSLVNIGGADIYEGNKKLILSVIWQSMRHQQLRLLSELAAKTHGRVGGSTPTITDSDIIQWANAKVAQGGNPAARPIVAFRDLTLADSVYLLSLVHAVEPRAVNWELVTTGATDDDKISNAKYAISCAQKIGATVFLTYEDIVEVKPKMMMTFVASLMSVDMHRH